MWHVIEFVTSKCSQVQSSKGDDGCCCFRGPRLVKKMKGKDFNGKDFMTLLGALSFSKTNFCRLRLGFHNTYV